MRPFEVGLRIALLGKQGAGKGTQARRVGAHYRVPHISPGDMFRAPAMAGSPVGVRATEYMDRGELVPDDIVMAVVTERLTQEDARAGFVLDGFPRTRRQAEALEQILVVTHLDAVIDIDVATPLVLRRLSGRRVCKKCGTIYHVDQPPRRNWTCDTDGAPVRQRPDDAEPAILRRLQLYEQEIGPVMNFYAELGILGVVSGVGTVEEVSDRIFEFIDSAGSGRPSRAHRP